MEEDEEYNYNHKNCGIAKHYRKEYTLRPVLIAGIKFSYISDCVAFR